MELNVKEQKEKLETEIAQLAGQIQQLEAQINQLTQNKSNLLQAFLKKQGALELLNNLDGKNNEPV